MEWLAPIEEAMYFAASGLVLGSLQSVSDCLSEASLVCILRLIGIALGKINKIPQDYRHSETIDSELTGIVLRRQSNEMLRGDPSAIP